MSDKPSHTVSGTVRDMFAHRFVLQTDAGSLLADLGPHGADILKLDVGDAITITGERKPSELKVFTVERNGRSFEIPHGDKHRPDKHRNDVDPDIARRAATDAGLTALGEPRRKAKHFEVLGRDPAGALVELHVELDGYVRKRKDVDASEPARTNALTSPR